MLESTNNVYNERTLKPIRPHMENVNVFIGIDISATLVRSMLIIV